MEVRYKDKKLREICEKKAAAEKKLGAASARKLKVRLLALEAATLRGTGPAPQGSKENMEKLDATGSSPTSRDHYTA